METIQLGNVTLQKELANELQIEQVNVSSFKEALVHIPQNSIVISDIDGTIFPIIDSLTLMLTGYVKPIYRLMNKINLKSENLESMFFGFKQKLISHFEYINSIYREKSNNNPVYVSNRIAQDQNLLHKMLDFSWGTTSLNNILHSAGISKVHFGLDRQSKGLLSAKGSWDRLILDLEEKINLSSNVLSQDKIKLAVVADNLNIIGEFASEPKFLKELIDQLSTKMNIPSTNFEGLVINIQKEKAILNRINAFIEA